MTSRLGKFRAAAFLLVWLTASVAVGFSRNEASPEAAAVPASQQTPNTDGVTLAMPFGQHTDDLDSMVKRRTIRAVVITNPIGFFYVDGKPMGVMYEALRDFETFVNQKLKTGAIKVEVTFIPERADRVETALTQGVGDVIAYALVVTPERQQQVAFASR